MAAPHLHVVAGGAPEELLTLDEIAKLTKFHRDFLMGEYHRGKLKMRKIGPGRKSIRVKRSDYDAWLASYFGE